MPYNAAMNVSFLQRAIDIAVAAHRLMEDPPGEPYILHPMRVMQRFSDPAFQAVAILHDTIERAGVTASDLQEAGLGKPIIEAVELLTHRDGVTYCEYVIALQPNPLARAVKLADLQDNADLRYVDLNPAKPKKSRRRVLRYALSYKFLTGDLAESDYRQLMKMAES